MLPFVITVRKHGDTQLELDARSLALSVLLGYWLWGDAPDKIAWLGMMLVLGAGLYTLHRERANWKAREVGTAP